MHPYYVHIPDDPILFAQVFVEPQRVTWKFYLQQSGSMNDAEFESVKNLFTILSLEELYSRVSIGEIKDRSDSIEEMNQMGGANEVQRVFADGS